MNQQAKNFVRNIRWAVCIFLSQDKSQQKETYGFNSQRNPDPQPLVEPFVQALYDAIKKIKFKQRTNNFQKNLKENVMSKINQSKKLLVKGDKSNNFHETDVEQYDKAMKREIQKDHKKASNQDFQKVAKEDRKMAEKMDIADRVFQTPKVEAFATIKDHKPNYLNSLPARLINGTKQNLGRASKLILEKIVTNVRNISKLNQWKNTPAMLQWFTSIPDKASYSFIQWDIVDFYGSISEQLFTDAVNWASNNVQITQDQRELFFQVRKSFLVYRNELWVKKENPDFYVAMGSYDSAEICELVGLYLLHLVNQANLYLIVGLYRDDALAITKMTTRQCEIAKRKIIKIFQDNWLKITIEVNLKCCDFLDVHLDLPTGTYRPYHKPNSNPVYVNVGSNHPKSVINNIPLGVDERLSMTSSNEEIFNANVGVYQEALESAGHKHKLKYVEKDIGSYNKVKKRTRSKKQYFFNPPYELNVKINVAKEVFKALERTIPKGHKLYPLLNRHTVKVTYSTMPNIQKKVSCHNKKVIEEAEKEEQQNQQQQNQQQQNQQQQNQQHKEEKEQEKRSNNSQSSRQQRMQF